MPSNCTQKFGACLLCVGRQPQPEALSEQGPMPDGVEASMILVIINASRVLTLCKHVCTHTKNVGGDFYKSQN
jgi:hypothetical protein